MSFNIYRTEWLLHFMWDVFDDILFYLTWTVVLNVKILLQIFIIVVLMSTWHDVNIIIKIVHIKWIHPSVYVSLWNHIRLLVYFYFIWRMKIVFVSNNLLLYDKKTMKFSQKDRNKTFKKRDTFYPYIIMYITNITIIRILKRSLT